MSSSIKKSDFDLFYLALNETYDPKIMGKNELRARTAKASVRIHQEREEKKAASRVNFTCPCPMAWALSNYVLSFFTFLSPEEQQWSNSKGAQTLKNEIELLCKEAVDKYLELQVEGRTTLQLFSDAFALAIQKEDYPFATKLMNAGVDIDVNQFPFTVKGRLNPAFRAIPQLFDHLYLKRGFLKEDRNSVSLLVALREMPAAAPLLVQAGVTPSSEHLDEAVCLDNEQAIALFQGMNVTTTSSDSASKIAQNDVKGVKDLLERGAKVPLLTDIDFVLNPLNRDMVDLLITKGSQFSPKLALLLVEKDAFWLIKKISSEPLKRKMLIHARNLNKEFICTLLILSSFTEDWERKKLDDPHSRLLYKTQVENCCLAAAKKFPELSITGKTHFQFLSEALETAFRKGDMSFAKELHDMEVEFDISHFDDLTFTVNGELNPIFIASPQLFDYLYTARGFLIRDINQRSLLVALREMPKAFGLLVKEGIRPTDEHFDEAIRQNNDQAIAFCLEKKILPSTNGMNSAIYNNKISLVIELLKRSAHWCFSEPLRNYEFMFNPANRMMVRYLLANRGSISTLFIDRVIQKGVPDHIKKTYDHISPRSRDHMIKEAAKPNNIGSLKVLILHGALPKECKVIQAVFLNMPELLFVLLGNRYYFTTTHLNGVLWFIKDNNMAKELLREMIRKGVKPDGGSLTLAMRRDDPDFIQIIREQGVNEAITVHCPYPFDSRENSEQEVERYIGKEGKEEIAIHLPFWFCTYSVMHHGEDLHSLFSSTTPGVPLDERGFPLYAEDMPPGLIDW